MNTMRIELQVESTIDFFTVRLCCPVCGHQFHQIDRRIVKEISLGSLVERVVELHGRHC